MEFLKKIIIVGITSLIITNMYYIPASANWINNSKNKWNWVEGEVKAIGWKEIDKKWYYFNKDGIMSTGWLNYNTKWYNLSSSGTMETGWKKVNGKWYHFNSDGVMSIGWIEENGNKYFTNSSGEMETGTLGIDGQVYTFSDSGAMIKNKETIQEIQHGTGVVSNVKSAESEKNDSKTRVTDVSSNSNSNVDIPPIDTDNIDLKDDSLAKGAIRDKEPSLDDKHYYSDKNLFYKIKLSPPFSSGGKLIKGNCTWYAWGRAWEITGSQPNDAGFKGNAYEWWEANKKSGKYQYGSQPRVGAISVWKADLPNSGGCGHVAVVEKIKDGKVYISESMWHGVTFKYREIYETNYLYGYIYLDKPNY